jgi:hypothetical protein
VLRGRGARLDAAVLLTGVTAGHPGLLHLVVLLNLGMDIRRLRSVASRRLVVTSDRLVSEAAVAAGSGRLGGLVDLRDPRPPSLSEVDRALGPMIRGIDGVDPEFLSSVRRHRDRLIGRWISGSDPVDVLSSTTLAESPGGGGERVARDLGLGWSSTLDVIAGELDRIVADLRAALQEAADERDALLG